MNTQAGLPSIKRYWKETSAAMIDGGFAQAVRIGLFSAAVTRAVSLEINRLP
jgi:hypothetical protein